MLLHGLPGNEQNLDLAQAVRRGGWVTAFTAAHDSTLAGAILISAADMGGRAAAPRERIVTLMAGNMEALDGVTAESMTDEVVAWLQQLR